MSWRVSAFFILVFCCTTSKSLAAEAADMYSLTTSQKEKISGLTYEKDYLAYPWNVKMSFAYSNLFTNIEVNYTLWKVLEIGVFTGIHVRKVPEISKDSVFMNEDGTLIKTSSSSDNRLKYGISIGATINLHFLPFFIHRKLSWDFYMVNKLYSGHTFFSSKYSSEPHTFPFCMEWGLGLAYFINSRMGLYGECTFIYTDVNISSRRWSNTVFRLGFRFGFNKDTRVKR